MVSSIALRFGTGSEPGSARQTGHVWELGVSKYATGQRQNIFVRVFRWTWISRPMTGSHALIDSAPERNRGRARARAHGRRGRARSRRTGGRSAADRLAAPPKGRTEWTGLAAPRDSRGS